MKEHLIQQLEKLAEELVSSATLGHEGIWEGTVMTVGPPPYRRLDCDGRALAYVRVRPRKHAVRVDISGLWRLGGDSPLRVPSASGAGTLLIQTREEAEAAVRYLRSVVTHTRETEAAYLRRRAA